MSATAFKSGDWVIYRLQKFGVKPGPRAEGIVPSSHGEEYSYLVDKYWVVEEVLGDDRLKLRTRKGKSRVVAKSDRRLRRPRWFERWLLARRFHAVEAAVKGSGPSASVAS